MSWLGRALSKALLSIPYSGAMIPQPPLTDMSAEIIVEYGIAASPYLQRWVDFGFAAPVVTLILFYKVFKIRHYVFDDHQTIL